MTINIRDARMQRRANYPKRRAEYRAERRDIRIQLRNEDSAD